MSESSGKKAGFEKMSAAAFLRLLGALPPDPPSGNGASEAPPKGGAAT